MHDPETRASTPTQKEPNHQQPPTTDPCIWEQDEDGIFETLCGQTFTLNEGTPKANKMHYCCYCGKKLNQVLYTE